jgi:hypothetical protein
LIGGVATDRDRAARTTASQVAIALLRTADAVRAVTCRRRRFTCASSAQGRSDDVHRDGMIFPYKRIVI